MIAIINYGLGNLTSVKNAFDLLGFESEITNDPEKIKNADTIVLPGVGAFKEGMDNLHNLGVIEVLNQEVLVKKKPFLGICLGMQLICNRSFEGGETQGLGWIDADVVKFKTQDLIIPHMGWNNVNCNLDSPIFKGSNAKQDFYFVHSFYVKLNEQVNVGTCDYGCNFAAVVQKNNIFATQFHPEKSQHEGLEMLRKFAELGGS
jgi:imidazole glycerol-phosphate synthase subunit HisH